MHRAMKELRDIFLRLTGGNQPCDVTTSPSVLRTI
jgi:hypothetical protein